MNFATLNLFQWFYYAPILLQKQALQSQAIARYVMGLKYLLLLYN